MTFFANRDAVRVCPGFLDVLIPVEWVMERRTRERSRETLKAAVGAFQGDRAVVLFPSGRIAFMDDEARNAGMRPRPISRFRVPFAPGKVLVEQEWTNTLVNFARKYDQPVVPLHIEARNSWLYYLFWDLSPELRDMTLFHELLNKKGYRFKMTFGAPVPASDLRGDPDEAAARLRAHAVVDVPEGAPWRPGRPALDVDVSRVKFRREA